MKNYEIANVNAALNELVDEPLKGKFKFKLFKIKATLEGKMEVILKALEGVEDEKERTEIINEEQEVTVDKLSHEELENIDLSIRQISMLRPIIEEGTNES